jgi:ankyrin repeat protein
MTPTLLSLPSKLLRATAFCKVWPADVTLRSCKNRSVLWYAAKGANFKIVQTLLDTGKLDHNAADNDGVTPFAYAGARAIATLSYCRQQAGCNLMQEITKG